MKLTELEVANKRRDRNTICYKILNQLQDAIIQKAVIIGVTLNVERMREMAVPSLVVI